MCIVVDTCRFSAVFNPKDTSHPDFEPLHRWIWKGKGKVLCGGSGFRKELKTASKYLGIFLELRKINKLVEIDDELVDKEAERLKKLIPTAAFDDPHILALIFVSRCKLLCTNDGRMFPFLRNKAYYPKNVSIPKLYRKKSHRSLLIERNIVACCRTPK